MKLLIITQTVDINDDVLGSFHRWLELFNTKVESLTVICLKKGEVMLPPKVAVYSLGKEKYQSRLLYIVRFYYYLWRLQGTYDHVFVHMNPIYIVMAGWWWRLRRTPIALWYTHRYVDWKLKIAEKFANVIFTAAPESFRIISSKVRIVGHGIDTDYFRFKEKTSSSDVFTIIHVGRITPIKNCEILLRATVLLNQSLSRPVTILFIGRPVTLNDKKYEQELLKEIKKLNIENQIVFIGSIPNRKIRDYYYQADLSVNLTPTGGIDRAVLESMATGTPVLTSNLAFTPYFGPYTDQLIFPERNEQILAEKIVKLLSGDRRKTAKDLSDIATLKFNVVNLINTILMLWK